MDPITRKLVETVRQITEDAARSGAAKLARMTDAQFQDYITSNPGTAEKAKQLRAQGQTAQPQSDSRAYAGDGVEGKDFHYVHETDSQGWKSTVRRPGPMPKFYTVSDSKHQNDSYFTNLLDRWTQLKYTDPSAISSDTATTLETRARQTKDAELHDKLMNHPEAQVRIWAAQNPLTNVRHIHDMLQHSDPQVRAHAITAKQFSKEHMDSVLSQAISDVPAGGEDQRLQNLMLLRRAMHTHPHLYTTRMHETLLNHPDSQIRSTAEKWASGGRQPAANDYKQIS